MQGPKAVDALARLVPEAANLVFMQAARATWGGHAIALSRSGYTGEDGFEISLPNEALTAFADALCAMDEVKPIGLGARDSLRLEAGLPLYGHDLTAAIDPAEADLGFAISKPAVRRRIFRARESRAISKTARRANGWGSSTASCLSAKRKLFDGEDDRRRDVGGFAQRRWRLPWVMSRATSVPERPSLRSRGKRCLYVAAMPFPHNYVRKAGGD